MTCDEALAKFGFVPALSVLGEVRRALELKMKWRRSEEPNYDDDDDHTDLLLVLCVQLFAARQVEDSLRVLNDGQEMLALNDLFLGRRGHASARYQLTLNDESENQSSSGLIVLTGAGSTGWLRSIVTGAARVMQGFGDETVAPDEESGERARFSWDEERLQFSVREPFVSKTSGAELVWGRIEGSEHLEVTSQIPQDGAIFSDGIEGDFLEWNISSIARVGVAERKLHLLTGS